MAAKVGLFHIAIVYSNNFNKKKLQYLIYLLWLCANFPQYNNVCSLKCLLIPILPAIKHYLLYQTFCCLFFKFYNTCGPLVIHELFIRIFAYSWPNIPVFFLKNPLNKNNHYSKHSRFCYSQNWYLVNAWITCMKIFTIIQTQKTI